MSDSIVQDLKHGRAAEAQGGPAIDAGKPTKAWEAEVDVYLKSVNPLNFELATCLPVDNAGNIVFYNNGRPGFMISFRLFDDTNNGNGSGYVFPNPPDPPNQKAKWAMWSSQGAGCPAPECGQWPEFTTVNVKDQGTTLVVHNTNSTQTLFGYTLRVTNDNGATFVDLDPGGNNMNGSTRFNWN